MPIASIIAVLLPSLLQLLSSGAISWSTLGTVLQALSAALTAIGAVKTHSASMKAAIGVNRSTTLLQMTLNNLQAAGQISFGQPLVVDGAYGPLTHVAVVAVQSKLGMTPGPVVSNAQYVVCADLLGRLG